MDATTLRIGIIAAGVVLVAGIYGWAKWQERSRKRGERIEPAVGNYGTVVQEEWEVIPVLRDRHTSSAGSAPRFGEETTTAVAERPRARVAPAERTRAPEPPPGPEAGPELIVTLSVLAPRGREFSGAELARALRQAGMVYGAMKIFHAPADLEQPDGPTLFSLANIVEPGTLEPERLRLLATPGVVLFTQLPGPVPGIEIFEHMQATGRFLAQELGGDLCDERRQPLTAEKVNALRSRILSDIGDFVRKPDL